jgi:hypothetical protein
VQRGLAKASIRALMWEGRHFLSWYVERSPVDDFWELTVRDIDIYFEMRAATGLGRRSLKGVAERLRSMLRFLHMTGRTGVIRGARSIIGDLLGHRLEESTLPYLKISAVLKSTRKILQSAASRAASARKHRSINFTPSSRPSL